MEPRQAVELARQLVEQNFDSWVDLRRSESGVDASVTARSPALTIGVLRDLVTLFDEWKRSEQELNVEIPGGKLSTHQEIGAGQLQITFS